MANNHQPPKQSRRHNYYAEQLTTRTDVTNLIKDNTRQVYPFNIVDIKKSIQQELLHSARKISFK